MSKSSSAASTCSPRKTICRPARLSLPSSRATCASATRRTKAATGPTAAPPDMVRVCVAGVTGWTGTAVAAAVDAADDLELVAGVSRASTYRSVAEALDAVEIDVVVDYTSAEAVKANVL